MLKVVETLRLIRFMNCLMAVIGVLVGSYMTWLEPVYYAPLVSALAAFLVCAAGNITNDLADTETDRINHPRRVLVRGTLTRRYAHALAIVCNVLAVIVAVSINLQVTIIALVAVLLLYLYNYRAKKVAVVGNMIIALLAALTFVTGGVAVDYGLTFVLPGPLIAAVFAFLFHFVREIVKDTEDIDGDRRAGIVTLPQIIGVQRSLLFALALFFVMVVFTCLPILRGWYGSCYKIITVYIIDLPLLAFLIFLWGNPSAKMLKVGSALLKIGMALGIVALVAAHHFR